MLTRFMRSAPRAERIFATRPRTTPGDHANVRSRILTITSCGLAQTCDPATPLATGLMGVDGDGSLIRMGGGVLQSNRHVASTLLAFQYHAPAVQRTLKLTNDLRIAHASHALLFDSPAP
jgi:hypothetical protein